MDKLQMINLVGVHFDKNSTQQHAKPKMLLVEDNPESANLMQHLCQGINCNLNIKCVHSAESAISLLEKDSHYDLIISDHFLFGPTTGLALWKVCNKRFRNIPFMLTSGLSVNEFSDLVKLNKDKPQFLSKTMDKKERMLILQEFLENALADHNKQKKSFAEFLFDTMTFIGLMLIFAILPNHLLSLKNTSPIALSQKQYFKPTEIKVDQQLKTEQQNQPRINIKEIITPELKQKINQIVKRADDINNL